MSQSERKAYYKQVTKIKFDPNGDISKIKRVMFPHQADFYFDNHRLNYNFIQKTL